MTNNLKELLKHIDVYDDSNMLIEMLEDIKNDYPVSDLQSRYWLNESIENIGGMWKLLNEIKEELNK